MASERAPYPLDLDQVDSDSQEFDSSQSGSWAIDETIPSG